MAEALDKILPLIRTRQYDKVFEILVDFQIGPDTVDTQQRQFLWYVVAHLDNARGKQEEFLECIHRLIKFGMNINHCDKYNETVLHLAAHRNHSYGCQLLIDQGATVDCKNNDDMTPLDFAMNFFEPKPQWLEAISTLLKVGADPYRKFLPESGWKSPADSAKQRGGELEKLFFDTLKEIGKDKPPK